MPLRTPPASPLVEDDDIGAPSPIRPESTTAPSEASSPSTSSSSTVAELLQATALNPVSSIDKRIAQLKEERQRIKKEKNELTKNLKLSERKRSRLKAKAKSLSSQGLVEVLQFRSVNQEKMAAARRARTTETAPAAV